MVSTVHGQNMQATLCAYLCYMAGVADIMCAVIVQDVQVGSYILGV